MKLSDYCKFYCSIKLVKRQEDPIFKFDSENKAIDFLKSIFKIKPQSGKLYLDTDIEAIRINVKFHSAKYGIDYKPELHMTAWEFSNYASIYPSEVIDNLKDTFYFWLDPKYAETRIGITTIIRTGILHEDK